MYATTRARYPEIRYTRLNEHYRPAVELARLVLRSDSYELRHGAVRGTSFLVDMNRVFEDFVVVAIREALGVSEHSFLAGSEGTTPLSRFAWEGFARARHLMVGRRELRFRR